MGLAAERYEVRLGGEILEMGGGCLRNMALVDGEISVEWEGNVYVISKG